MSLDKVAILGVRSFGPREEHTQVIKFAKPLTLISGKNGAGKTTIIECLKYATTGEMPPNSDKGHSFVHDPKVADEREVKGQVKLQFWDTHNMKRVVTRSMKATQKKKKMEFKTLDSCMQLIDQAGKKTTITSKCTDMNQEMVEALGVSKAILANVIFCHQEDSNWPLSHGKVVKERFDDIFSATRFIKALANIKDQWKKLEVRNRVSEAGMKGLLESKKRAIDTKKDLENAESRSIASKEALSKLDQRLVPVQEKLGLIRKNEKDVVHLSTELAQKEAKYKEAQKTCKNLKCNIKEEFTGTTSELEKLLKNFTKHLEDSQKEKLQLESEIQSVSAVVSKTDDKISKGTVEIGKLEIEEKNHNAYYNSAQTIAKKLVLEYRLDVELSSEKLGIEECKLVHGKMNTNIGQMKEDYRSLKAEHETREKEVQKRIDELRDKRTQLSQIASMKDEQILKNNKEIASLDKKLSQVESSVWKLKTLEEELDNKNKELETCRSSFNESSHVDDAQRLKGECSDYEAKIRQLDDEFVKLNQNASLLAELNMAKKDKTAKEGTLRKIKSKNEDKLQLVLGEIPEWQSVRSKIREFVMIAEKELKQMNERREKLLIGNNSAESKRKMLVKDIESKEKELKEYEQNVFEVCGSRELEDGIAILECQMKESQNENGSLSGTQFVYTKFVEKLRQTDPSCPLCHQSFREQSDVTELIEEVEEKVRLIPTQLVATQKKIKELQDRFNKLVELRTIKKRMDVWFKEVPEMKAELQTLTSNLAKNQAQLSETEEGIKTCQAKLSAAIAMQPDVAQLDQFLADVRKIDQRIQNSAVPSDESRNAKIVQEEKRSIQSQLDAARTLLNTKNRDLNSHREKLQDLKTGINKAKEEHLRISKDAQERNQWKNKKEELMKEVESILKESKETQAKIPPIQENLDSLIRQKSDNAREKETVLRESEDQIATATSKMNALASDIQTVERYIRDGRDVILNSSRRELIVLKDESSSAKNSWKKLAARREELLSELANHESRKREMFDNLELRKKDSEMASLDSEIQELKTRLGDLNINTLESDKKKLMDDEEQIHGEKNLLRGRSAELQDNIRRYKGDLNKDPLKNAVRDYQKAFIEVESAKVVVKDLKKLYLALDRAIKQYHNRKMEEVNKIVKELWQNTYKGKDIDYIEICTDTTETDETTIDKRKVIDYKVIKVKDGRRQDMRGQCSAGQRVLACLIIRLALAESLSYDCGIFALDEPTTNLDKDNINSLAIALQDIVNSRALSNTFQLIIITHDKDFLDRIGHSGFVDYHYEISKTDEGNSTITKVNLR